MCCLPGPPQRHFSFNWRIPLMVGVDRPSHNQRYRALKLGGLRYANITAIWKLAFYNAENLDTLDTNKKQEGETCLPQPYPILSLPLIMYINSCWVSWSIVESRLGVYVFTWAPPCSWQHSHGVWCLHTGSPAVPWTPREKALATFQGEHTAVRKEANLKIVTDSNKLSCYQPHNTTTVSEPGEELPYPALVGLSS